MKKNYLLAIASYTDEKKQAFFEKYVSTRNKEYCKLHNFEYIEITSGVRPIRDQYFWFTSFKHEEIINDVLNEGDGLVSVDADAIIVDIDRNLLPPNNKNYAYSIDTANTHCMGWSSFIKSEWTTNMLSLINSQDRYDALIDKTYYHEGKKTEDSFWREFAEQASWYSLSGIKRHSNESFWNLPDFGWHSAKDEWTIYSLNELHKNVHIFPSEYNVTELHGESFGVNYINKVKYNDVVIRHFAGGQKWRSEWINTKSLYFRFQKINIFKYINTYKIKTFFQKLKGFISSKIN